MTIADRLPSLDETSLSNLKTNTVRLAGEPDGPRRSQAIHLLPLIDAEIAARAERAPPKPAARPRAKPAARKTS